MTTAGDFDAIGAFRVLLRHGVRFVVIGGVAGRQWGSPLITHDTDICYERTAANYQALVSALKEMNATLRGAPAGLPFQLDAKTIAFGDSFTFETTMGPLDCLGTPSGTSGYPDLMKSATQVEIDDGVSVYFCSLDDLMRMKRAANRPKDRIELEILAAVKEEREKLGL